jgi:hypothetical protein
LIYIDGDFEKKIGEIGFRWFYVPKIQTQTRNSKLKSQNSKPLLNNPINKFIMKSLIFTFALLLTCLTTFSQTWYFGANAGLKFTPNGIEIDENSQMNTREGCAVAYDVNGNARIYTDGSTVYSIDDEGNHSTVVNGTGLNGDASSTQSAIIVPLPGSDCSRYIIYTVDNAEDQLAQGLQYSIVDFSTNPIGEIAANEKNIQLEANSSEKLTAYSIDGDNFWVLAHGYSRQIGPDEGRNFYAYKIDGPEVPTEPTYTSTVGTSHQFDNANDGYGTAQGQMKFSHDGAKVAVTISQGRTYPNGQFVEVFDFNSTTGEVYNSTTITFNDNDDYPYGVEFAPNNHNILYISDRRFGSINTDGGIHQVDLEPLMPNNEYNISDVSNEDGFIPLDGGFALQLGPDNNIYVALYELATIGQISNSDNLGAIEYDVVSLDNDPTDDFNPECIIGLPTVIQGNFVCKKECGAVFAENVNFSCPNSYTYAFQLQNNLPELEVTSALIHSITPEGVTLSNQFFNFYQDPLDPNGGTSQTLEVEIFLDSPLEEDLEVCFSVTYFSKEDECCFFEHCIILEAVNPCESVGVVEALETEESCCYEVYLSNDFCPDFFTGIRIESNTEGVIFSGFEEIGGWTATPSEDLTSILWTQEGGFSNNLPLGALDPISFCLDGVTSEDQFPQVVTLSWLGIDPATGEEIVYCEEKLEFECKPCMFIEGDVVCVNRNEHIYDFTITNNSDQVASMIVFEVHTPNVWFEPPMINLPEGLEPGQSYTGSIQITTINGNPLPPNTVVAFKVLLMDLTGWCCHSDEISITIPRCTPGNSPFLAIRSNVATPVEIYPNPASQLLQITVPKEGRYSITIFDTNGKQTANYRDYLYERQPFGMDVSGLVNGVYFIRLEDQDGVMEQRRFIKAQ